MLAAADYNGQINIQSYTKQAGNSLNEYGYTGTEIRKEKKNNVEESDAFLYTCKDENLLDGSGLSEEANERILLVRECDVFVDGLFEDDKKDLSLAWRGSKNQRVIDMNKTKDKVVLYCE